MLNNYSNLNLSFNSVSGTLVKSHPKSFMVVRRSKGYIFDDAQPRLTNSYGGQVVVLQVMLIGENQMLCEVIRPADFIQEDKPNA